MLLTTNGCAENDNNASYMCGGRQVHFKALAISNIKVIVLTIFVMCKLLVIKFNWHCLLNH